jgi:hypothetical protein
MSVKEYVLSNVIGLNPTGTMNFEGTYQMNGNNDIVRTGNNASLENLKKTQKNEVICGITETFENYEKKKDYKNIFLIIIILFLIILLIKNLYK